MEPTTKNISARPIWVAIGLGSNWGDRLFYLQAALNALGQGVLLSQMRVSAVMETPALLKENAPEAWNKPFLNAVLTAQTQMSAQALLGALKRIEKLVGRQDRGVWAPREIDLDLLLYGQQVIEAENLMVPHPQMLQRDFVMLPLAQIAGGWRVPNTTQTVNNLAQKFNTAPRWMEEKLRVPKPPVNWVGILNLTPDSFSKDGMANDTLEHILEKAQHLMDEGARVLDVGAESTRPNAVSISAEEEWARLSPVWKELRAITQKRHVKLSIDTRHNETARRCFVLGVDWINDVSGFRDAAMLDAVRDTEAKLVVMHSLSVPADPTVLWSADIDPAQEMQRWMLETQERLQYAGIAAERVIYDPGIGFGKSAVQSHALLKDAQAWRLPNTAVLVGHSRKSFLGLPKETPNEMKDAATLEISASLVRQGVEYLRVHDVGLHHTMLGDGEMTC